MTLRLALALMVLLALPGPAAGNGCLDCHGDMARGFVAGHGFARADCTLCHGGDAGAAEPGAAHQGMRRAPASLEHAGAACGGCHEGRVHDVAHGFMATGKGIVNVTRWAFGEQPAPSGAEGARLSALGHSPADSLLRKRCASCHLEQPRREPPHGAIGWRGGGCAACHLAETGGHPALTARVGDERCLGCHSRSGRTALSYAGIAEAGTDAHPGSVRQLTDGRRVVLREPDVHHRAGLGCIDCHTAAGLMGSAEGLDHHEQAVDIACADCHANPGPRVALADWPAEQSAFQARVPFAAGPEQPFLATARRGSVLWHVELTGDGALLHPKRGGPPVPIPQARAESHPALAGAPDDHGRLACASCHSRWAPQCYGCHMRYDPDGVQWDHLEQRVTPGRWDEARRLVRNTLPPLGVGADGEVRPFVPGMIFTARHPDWEHPRFRRLFAALSPHTVGPSRSCASCHASAAALGLGAGALARTPEGWRHTPREPRLADGLPRDAWTDLQGRGGGATRVGERPFTPAEMRRILDAPLGAGDLAP